MRRYVVLVAYEPGHWDSASKAVRQEYFAAHHAFEEYVEQVGGYYDIELPDLDSAIAAGSLLPSSYAVEIRPAITIEGYEAV